MSSTFITKFKEATVNIYCDSCGGILKHTDRMKLLICTNCKKTQKPIGLTKPHRRTSYTTFIQDKNRQVQSLIDANKTGLVHTYIFQCECGAEFKPGILAPAKKTGSTKHMIFCPNCIEAEIKKQNVKGKH